MKQLYLFLLTLVVVSCGAPSGYFRLEGHFQNLNQGEFYLYSLDGRGRLDTISLREGRFVFEMPVEASAAYSLIFPNFSEIPVFVESGATIYIQGDASHLKEVRVAGTDENDLMTELRLKIADATPPKALKEVETFINAHPATACSVYLLEKYFLFKPDPDYKKATALCKVLKQAQPGNERLIQLSKQLKGLKALAEGQKLPAFSAVDLKGQRVSNASLTGELNVINVWATWNYETVNLMRQLRVLRKDFGSRLGLMSICLDAGRNDCRKSMSRDSVTWSVVCDGKMFDTPVLSQLGIADIPYNVLTDRSGKILAINLAQGELRERIKKTLK